MDRGAWKAAAAVHGVAEGQIGLSDYTFIFMHWRRKWQPTLVLLPGESQGWGSLVGCRLWVSQSRTRTRLKRLSSSSGGSGSDGKESACNAGNLGSIPGTGRYTREGKGSPLQYSCLKNSINRETWQATVGRIAKSWT